MSTKTIDWKNLTMLALLGAGAYIAAKTLGFVKDTAGFVKDTAKETADAISRPIAYIISSLILPASVHINGGAILPDGGYVSWDAIVQAGSQLDAKHEFTWKGIRYRAVKRRTDGNYDAIRV